MKTHFSLINPLRPHREADAAAIMAAAGSTASMPGAYASMLPRQPSGSLVVRKLATVFLMCEAVMERDRCSSYHARKTVREVDLKDHNWSKNDFKHFVGKVMGMLLDNPNELRPVLECMLRLSRDPQARPNATHFRSCIRRALASNPTRLGLGF